MMVGSQQKRHSGAAGRGALRPGGRTERVRMAVATTVLGFIQNGLIDFSVQDVANSAGVSRSTLYARWPTREALITEALTVHSLEFQFEPGANWEETLRNLVYSFRDFSLRPTEIAINSFAAFSKGGFISQETGRIWSCLTNDAAEYLEKAKTEGLIRPEVDPKSVVTSILSSISGLVVIGKIEPDDEMMENMIDIYINGCSSK